MEDGDPLIPRHGGYRQLKTFQLARLVYGVTVRFCDRYVDRRSRTRDQMVQAARSGYQNLAEGSEDSATSKKLEMNLTNVSRSSLGELEKDYGKHLRRRGLRTWQEGEPGFDEARALHEDRRAWIPVHERIAILQRAGALMRERAETLAMQIAREGGKPLVDARAETSRAIQSVVQVHAASTANNSTHVASRLGGSARAAQINKITENQS